MSEHGAARARETFLWMAILSIVTLLLGVLRELVIARELRASGAADLFFRGLVVIGATRGFGLALLRARWIPVPRAVASRGLLRAELPTLALILGVAALALALIVGADAWRTPTGWAIALCVPAALLGGALRVLSERAGYEKRGFAFEWGVPLGTIAGALLLPGGALGPAVGLLGGLALGGLVLAPTALRRPEHNDLTDTTSSMEAARRAGFTRWLMLDTLLYVNLGLLDAACSPHIFDEGGFALLNYAYLFVNAALMVPTAAATIVALRYAAAHADAPARAHVTLRRWSLLGGVLMGAAVTGVGLLLGWARLAAPIDAAAGWAITASIRPLVLYSAPFAALRFANTVGRQQRVAHAPRSLVPWDLLGLLGRAALLIAGAAALGLGPAASPLALALAELAQLLAWARRPPDPAHPAEARA
ncbi:MAG: hypothetical protein H6713_03985 [Myxococcales bacterium]|nr:hypothetical protein [Myxococcales bacterium]